MSTSLINKPTKNSTRNYKAKMHKNQDILFTHSHTQLTHLNTHANVSHIRLLLKDLVKIQKKNENVK